MEVEGKLYVKGFEGSAGVRSCTHFAVGKRRSFVVS